MQPHATLLGIVKMIDKAVPHLKCPKTYKKQGEGEFQTLPYHNHYTLDKNSRRS